MASIQETLGAGRKGYATLIAADPPRRGVIRRIVLPTALATVLLGFAAIVWLAWQESLSGSAEPPLIRAAAGPIKRPPDTPGGVDIEGERLGVTSVLAGPPPQPRVERLLPREPTPPKSLAEADPALFAPPAAPPATEPRTAPVPASPPAAAAPAEAPRGPEPSRVAEPVRPMPVPPAAEPAPAAPSPPAAPSGTAGLPRPGPSPAPAPTAPGPGATAAASPSPAAPPPSAAGPVPGPAAALPPRNPAAAPPAPPSPTAAPPTPARPAVPPAAPPPERLAAREPSSAPAAGSGGRGPWGVQIGAVSSREAAERGWAQLQGRHPEVLGPLQLRVDEAKLPTGATLYRLQGLGFADRESAAQACTRLKAAGTECFVVGGR